MFDKLTNFFSLICQGEKGEIGMPGKDGNASMKVQYFYFTFHFITKNLIFVNLCMTVKQSVGFHIFLLWTYTHVVRKQAKKKAKINSLD